ncbi:MAG: hypothetical protein RL430_2153 [Actinomycetota bacterium]
MIEMNWFMPTGGDSRDVLPDAGSNRAPSVQYLQQIAQACEQLGFEAVLTPCGTGCEDAWISTAALLAVTDRLKFLVAFRPALLTPTLAAQMASTYQRVSNGRLLVNIVTGAEQAELARFGVTEDKATRYARTAEFVKIMRGAWSGQPFSFKGDFFDVTDATTRDVPDPVPPIYFGGASEEAENVAAETIDLYLSWGETPQALKERMDRVAAKAASFGRKMRFGVRFHVIARKTSEEAWAVADNILASMSPEAIAAAREDFLKTQSVGQRRQFDLHGGDVSKLEIHPNVWASRSTRTCGPASASCAAVWAQHSSAVTRKSRTASRSTTHSATTPSSCPGTRISRRRTGSARASCPSCARAGSCRN